MILSEDELALIVARACRCSSVERTEIRIFTKTITITVDKNGNETKDRSEDEDEDEDEDEAESFSPLRLDDAVQIACQIGGPHQVSIQRALIESAAIAERGAL